jgi:hypothetical protein
MSSRIRPLLIVCLLAALAAWPAAAQTPQASQDRSTSVEFTTITRLPGITLQPGKYVFRLGTPAGKQTVVEVYSTDGTKKIATLQTIDYTGPRTGDASTIVFDKIEPPMLRVWYFPGDTVGREFVYTGAEAQTIGQAVRAISDAAKEVGRAVVDVAQDVWDDIEDNARLVNPTDTRKAAERHLDNAERAYSQLIERLDDAQEAPVRSVGAHLEALEDAFEKNDAAWMTHYTPLLAELDRLAPEGPVGTSGSVRLDASTTAALVSIRAHLKAFHAQAMK